MQQRPTGVTILAILAAIGGVFSIMGGLAVAGLGGLAGAMAGSGELGALSFVLGGVTVILGGLWIAVAIGFWGGRAWSWALAVVLALVNIGVTIAELVLGYSSIFSAIIAVVIPAIILYYLNQPAVKRFFGR